MKTDMELYKELADKFEKALEDRDAWEREARAARELISFLEFKRIPGYDGEFECVSCLWRNGDHAEDCGYAKSEVAYLAARVPDGETA